MLSLMLSHGKQVTLSATGVFVINLHYLQRTEVPARQYAIDNHLRNQPDEKNLMEV